MFATLLPAYGRQVTTGKAAKADWLAGKDWKLASTGQYCSVRDIPLLKAQGVSHVELCGRDRTLAVVKL